MNSWNVFICHNSEDKESFVKPFAEKLRRNGVDASYDEWELNLGDSLINIFDRIDESDILCIIISKSSINSNWVNEETDAGIYRKITKGMKIIPIIIDKNVALPNSLKHTEYIIINDKNEYDEEFEKILKSINGNIDKPPLGNTPLYSGNLSHLEEQELNIFKSLGDFCLRNYGFNIEILPTDIMSLCNYTDEEISDSLNILINEELLMSKGSHEGFAFTSKEFTIKGFYMYFKIFIKDYENIYKKIIKSILKGNESVENIIQDTQIDKPLVISLLWLFRKKGFIICNAQFNIMGITSIGKNYFKKELAVK